MLKFLRTWLIAFIGISLFLLIAFLWITAFYSHSIVTQWLSFLAFGSFITAIGVSIYG